MPSCHRNITLYRTICHLLLFFRFLFYRQKCDHTQIHIHTIATTKKPVGKRMAVRERERTQETVEMKMKSKRALQRKWKLDHSGKRVSKCSIARFNFISIFASTTDESKRTSAQHQKPQFLKIQLFFSFIYFLCSIFDSNFFFLFGFCHFIPFSWMKNDEQT